VPILTGLSPDPRQPGYRLVVVDRGRFSSLPAEALAGLPLRIGESLSDALFARLQALADLEAAYRAALRLLATRSRSRADLRRRLVHKQHPPAAADGALSRLEARGLLDDRRFAREYTASHAARGRGPSRILQDLLAQGVERRAAEEALRTALAEERIDPARAARSVAEKRARQLGDLPAHVRRRRLLAYLARRGFRGAGARELVEGLVG
jgi:regulatory protein